MATISKYVEFAGNGDIPWAGVQRNSVLFMISSGARKINSTFTL